MFQNGNGLTGEFHAPEIERLGYHRVIPQEEDVALIRTRRDKIGSGAGVKQLSIGDDLPIRIESGEMQAGFIQTCPRTPDIEEVLSIGEDDRPRVIRFFRRGVQTRQELRYSPGYRHDGETLDIAAED